MTIKSSNSCCCSSEKENDNNSGSCCSSSGDNTKVKAVKENTEITIDGKVLIAVPGDKNIVDVADRARIGIPAPCY